MISMLFIMNFIELSDRIYFQLIIFKKINWLIVFVWFNSQLFRFCLRPVFWEYINQKLGLFLVQIAQRL